MEPRIQYAKAEDGVSIAFYTLGEGMPIVQMPPLIMGHIQLEWQNEGWRSWDEQMAEKRMLIRYDPRGSGLSDRVVTDYSLNARTRDLEAVVDHLGLEMITLVGPLDSGPAAIAYAFRQPKRVSRLLLWSAYARTEDVWRSAQFDATYSLVDKDWRLFTEMVSHVILGWEMGEEGHWFAEYIRECIDRDTWKAAMAALLQSDATKFLPRLEMPTLVACRRQSPYPELEVVRRLASRIPNARLALLEGNSPAPWVGDSKAVLQAIDEFLGEGEQAAPAPLVKEDIHTILFTDVEGSTALHQRLGDAKAREILREHERIVRGALESHGGSELKTMGDGFIASFSSATKALECAIAVQRAFAQHNESAEEPIKVRVGLNAGEPIAEDQDLFGTAVNVAARVCARAEAGQILAPIVVRELAAGKPFLFADLGETELRGYEDPVRLFEVRWRD